MKLYKNKQFIIYTSMSFILFASLLFYRAAFFSEEFRTAKDKSNWTYNPLKSDESWMNIFQNFKKIGFTHRKLENIGNGYQIHEETIMKINTMGMVQDVYVESKSTTDIDFAVSSFDFKITSGSFNFSVHGEIKGKTLYVKSNNKTGYSNNDEKTVEIPLENRPYLTSGVVQATLASGLKEGQEMVIFIFDPSTLGQSPATIKMEGREILSLNGTAQSFQKVSLSFKGAKQFAWIDGEGNVVKERGFLGITLLKTDKKGAIGGSHIEESDDLTELVSVKSNKTLENTEILKSLSVKITGIDVEQFDIAQHDGRQKWGKGVLTVKKESIDGLDDNLTPDDLVAIEDKFRQPDTFVQSNDYRIKSFAFKSISPSDTPLEKVKKLVAWIQKNIRRQPVVSLPNALSTLENRMGDCNEHAALLAAFCRAVGIPAKIEAGLVYLNKNFYYHAWNSVFIGRWITVDSLFNQIPADVTHIAFSSGSQNKQLDIMGLIGKIEIEIIDYTK